MRPAADSVFVLMLAAVSVADLRHRLIPNRVLALAVAIGLPLLAAADLESLPGRLVAGFAAGGAFLAIALVRPGGFGMGDVKLIVTMGLFLGAGALGAILVALLSGSLLGLALVIRRGAAATKATIPFGPFLALGGMLAVLGWIPPLQ